MEGVVLLLHQEGVVAGAVVQPRLVRVLPEVHLVVREPGRDVDAAAADARAGAVDGAPGVVAERHAAGVVGERVVVAALGPLALDVAQGVAADDDEMVVGVGDAVHVFLVELHVAVAPGVHLVGGVEALPPDGQRHAGLRRPDGEVVDRDGHRGAGKHRPAAVAADDLEAFAEAAGADAERVLNAHTAAAVHASAAGALNVGGGRRSRCC